ncbi:MAG: RNA methyltransferase [Paracoccaceae bacterium]
MAGTDRSGGPETPVDGTGAGPISILVEPQMGDNIGAAARALWNFGLRAMRIVGPRDGWPNPKAVAMASGAGGLLDEAQIFPDTAAAIADLTLVYATTARPRELTKRVLTPKAAMAEAAAALRAGERVGVLYGRERTGLENEDIVRASAIVRVPTNPAFGSINLAQAVLLMAYEWRLTHDATPPEELAMGRSERATAEDVARMVAHLVEELDRCGFFFPEHKRPSMLANLENLFRRTPLTDQDVRTLRGVIRTLAEGRVGVPRSER